MAGRAVALPVSPWKAERLGDPAIPRMRCDDSVTTELAGAQGSLSWSCELQSTEVEFHSAIQRSIFIELAEISNQPWKSGVVSTSQLEPSTFMAPASSVSTTSEADYSAREPVLAR